MFLVLFLTRLRGRCPFLSRRHISGVIQGLGASVESLMGLLGTCFGIRSWIVVSNEFHMSCVLLNVVPLNCVEKRPLLCCRPTIRTV